MLMHKASRLVSSPDWIYEPKWDGFLVIATVRDGSVRLLSRNGHSFTRVFGAVSDALRSFPASLVLDGEVVAITDEGRPDFEALQQRLRPRDGKLSGHLCYMVFDCVYVNGHTLFGRPGGSAWRGTTPSTSRRRPQAPAGAPAECAAVPRAG
jgi:bifunctional non-homologous end joining protein LigD